MSELAPNHDLAPRPSAGDDAALTEQWAAIEDAARVVALLAGRPAPVQDVHAEARIALLCRADAERSAPARAALGELVATMRVGLDALLGAHGTAANPRPAAVRLWHEYERGRAAVLDEARVVLAC